MQGNDGELIWTGEVRNEKVLQSRGRKDHPAYLKKNEGYILILWKLNLADWGSGEKDQTKGRAG